MPWGKRLSSFIIVILAIACSPDFERHEELDTGINTVQNELPTETLPHLDNSVGGATEQEEFFCDEVQPTLITDLEVYQPIALAEPMPRVEFLDPVFESCLARVTDHSEINDADASFLGIKNEYSRIQSFNADGSYIIVFSTTGNWYLYDSNSLEFLRQLPVKVEPRWDAQDPDLLYFSDGTALKSHRISTDSTETIHEFADDFVNQEISAVWTRYEGSPTMDTRYWGLLVEDTDWNPAALLVYDLETDLIIAKREVVHNKDIDSVTISPLGTYLLVFQDDYCENGQLGDVNNPCGLMVYNRDLQDGRGLMRIVGHADIVLDKNGREVLVYQDIDTDNIAMLDLESGEVTALWPIDFSHPGLGFHFSGKAY
jgi:hypothetical protein